MVVDTAIILAGGFGTRLQSVVSDLPKPLAPINDEAFLNYQLRYLRHFGIKKVVMSVGHLAEKITSLYQSNFEGIEVVYATEDTPLGTGGAIRLALQQISTQHVLILNGDSFFDVPLREFISLHKKYSAEISIALRKVINAARYGSIEVDHDNRITSFLEKKNEDKAGLINGGIYLLQKDVFIKNTEADKNFSIEKDFFQVQIKNRIIKGFTFDGYFIDIGLPEDYYKAQNDFKEFKYR